MAGLCREFGISRVTGYKIFDRYKECGLEAFRDRSRRPYRHANKLPFQVERSILAIKREHTSWGAPKIRDKLIRQRPMLKPPAVSTIHAVLDRQGLVKRRKRRRYKARGTELTAAHAPNGLWCADFKGEFMLRQQAVLLSAHDHRLPLPLPARLRRPLLDSLRVRVCRIRARLQGLRTARCHPHR